ncbi:MAG: hypothetical protein KBT77_09145 [Thalassolituus oleivorans]|uniref:hypothetical protein n=1 Tax=Thalassolituus oleivorans TaxID=187493 RepID=UPI001B3DF1D4|nr:hypothetical protein [Thalassolituus oleivorans]MBQ0727498.1 hypothetical protein [Thalassolituus oleivorans]
MFEYDKIEPVFPGNHVKDWQKIRKKQWKFVKNIIEESPHTSLLTMISDIKKEYYLLESPNLNAPFSEWAQSDISNEFHPFQWQGPLWLNLMLCSDQSEEAWANIWQHCVEYGCGFEGSRNMFIKYNTYIGQSEESLAFGIFGGLEQRMLPYFVQSEVYTDDKFALGRAECRKIPWKTPQETFRQIFFRMSKLTADDGCMSPFRPYQWLHGLLVSTFSYDLLTDEELELSATFSCQDVKNVLRDNADELYHPNNIKANRLMIEILEDEGTPQWLRKIWADVRDGKLSV